MSEAFPVWEWMRAVRDRRGLSAHAKAVLLCLGTRADSNGRAWPSLTQLRDDTGLSLASVKRALEAVRSLSLVRVQGGHTGKANHYKLIAPRKAHGEPTELAPAELGSDRAKLTGNLAQGELEIAQGEPPRISKKDLQISPSKTRSRARVRATPSKWGRWRRIPADWQPNDEHRAEAKRLCLDFELELAKIRDHEFSKTKTDPDGTFRNWLRNAASFAPAPRGSRLGSGPIQPNSGFDFTRYQR